MQPIVAADSTLDPVLETANGTTTFPSGVRVSGVVALAGIGELRTNLTGSDGHNDGLGNVDFRLRYSLVLGHAKV